MAVRFWELSNYRKCWHCRWWCAYAQRQLQYTVTTMNGFKILLLSHKFCWDKVVLLLPDSTFLEPKDLITDLGTMNQIPSLRRRSFPTESRILTAQELLMEYSLVVILLGCFIVVSSSSKMVRQLEIIWLTWDQRLEVIQFSEGTFLYAVKRTFWRNSTAWVSGPVNASGKRKKYRAHWLG